MKKISSLMFLLASVFCMQAQISTFPYLEDFETALPLPSGWTVFYAYGSAYPNCNSANAVATTTAQAHTGNRSILFRSDYGGACAEMSYLVSPQLDLGAQPKQLRFYVKGAQAENCDRLRIGTSTTSNGLDDFTFGEYTYINNPTSWEVMETTLDASVKYVCLSYRGEHCYQVYVDGFEILEPLTCVPPENLAVSTAGATTATLTWSEAAIVPSEGYELYWSLNSNAPSTLPGSSASTLIAQGTTDQLSGLLPNATYYAWIRALCGSGDTSAWSGMTLFHTLPSAATLPYFTDFEGYFSGTGSADSTRGWQLLSDLSTNHWVVNSSPSANQNGGEFCLYVSSDYATPPYYNYYMVEPSNVYAVKRFHFAEPGSYSVEYDWKAQGDYDPSTETCYDYMQAWLVPGDITLSTESLPDPGLWINVCGDTLLFNRDTWQHHASEFQLAAPGDYQLVFYWHNDGVFGMNPPGAVDNISLRAVTCAAAPTNLSATDLQADEATLLWDIPSPATPWLISYKAAGDPIWSPEISHSGAGRYTLSLLQPNTEYAVKVRAVCGEGDYSYSAFTTFFTECGSISTLPWRESFDEYEVIPYGLTIPRCMAAPIQSFVYPSITTLSAYSAPQSLIMGEQSLFVLPRFEAEATTLQLSCQIFQENLAYGGTLTLGVMTDPQDSSTFMPVQILSPLPNQTAWHPVSVLLNAVSAPGSHYIAFKHTGSFNPFYIDDIQVDYILSCRDISQITAGHNPDGDMVLTWTPGGDETQWLLDLEEESGADIHFLVSGVPSHTVSGLPEGRYTATIRAFCGEGDTSHAVASTFTIVQPGTIPFVEDFDGSSPRWDLRNGQAKNHWTINSSPDATGDPGNHACLYVSNDNLHPATYNYTVAFEPARIHALKPIRFEQTGDYRISYQWRGVGETDGFDYVYDYAQIALYPATTTVEAGSPIDDTYCVALSQPDYLLNQLEWQPAEASFSIPDPGLYYLVITWVNDNIGGNQPPAAFDNIILEKENSVQEQMTRRMDLYPNPASNRVTVKTDQPVEKVALYTSTGQDVGVFQNPSANSFDISGLTAGCYWVRITVADRVYQSKLVILR